MPLAEPENWVERWQENLCHNGRSCTWLQVAHPYEGGEQERKLVQIVVRCPLGEKSRADRAAKAAIKKAKTGKEQVIDEYEYSVLIVSTEHLAQVEEFQSSPLLEQVHFYDSRATIESASI